MKLCIRLLNINSVYYNCVLYRKSLRNKVSQSQKKQQELLSPDITILTEVHNNCQLQKPIHENSEENRILTVYDFFKSRVS